MQMMYSTALADWAFQEITYSYIINNVPWKILQIFQGDLLIVIYFSFVQIICPKTNNIMQLLYFAFKMIFKKVPIQQL